MGWLFPTAAFNGFGPSAFHGWGTSRATFVSAGNTKTLLKKLAEICPRGQSGVYALVNGRGELYYLGKAKCLRTRLLGYFNPSSRKAKSGRLARVARTIWWEPVPDEFGTDSENGPDLQCEGDSRRSNPFLFGADGWRGALFEGGEANQSWGDPALGTASLDATDARGHTGCEFTFQAEGVPAATSSPFSWWQCFVDVGSGRRTIGVHAAWIGSVYCAVPGGCEQAGIWECCRRLPCFFRWG